MGALTVALVGAIVRPWGLSESILAVPAALVLVAAGVVSWSEVGDTLRELGPTVLFLAGILLFGHLCAEAGVFDYLGAIAAGISRGRTRRLLGTVVALAAGVTAVLTLDATVVLLTPVVLRTTQRLEVRSRPHLYACAHLANSGSLLLPVSNLTNLLAFAATGLSFGRFTALMALPWTTSCLLDWLALRWYFRGDLTRDSQHSVDLPAAPRYALTILTGTVAGFVVTSAIDVPPAWAAWLGVVALAAPALKARRTTWRRMAGETSPGFVLFVLALGVIFDGVRANGLHGVLAHLVPDGTGLLALIGLALLGALLANVVNNIPATLALLPLRRRFTAGRARRAHRSQRRTELHVRRFTRHLALAAAAVRIRSSVGADVPSARRGEHAADTSRRNGGTVGVVGGDRRMIIRVDCRRGVAGVGSRHTERGPSRRCRSRRTRHGRRRSSHGCARPTSPGPRRSSR